MGLSFTELGKALSPRSTALGVPKGRCGLYGLFGNPREVAKEKEREREREREKKGARERNGERERE